MATIETIVAQGFSLEEENSKLNCHTYKSLIKKIVAGGFSHGKTATMRGMCAGEGGQVLRNCKSEGCSKAIVLGEFCKRDYPK